jgi:hypothetical protein
MRFRKLRITWTAICGIACVLLLVLWVRSYWHRDYLYAGLIVRQAKVTSIYGQLIVLWFLADEPDWARGSQTAEEWSSWVSKYGLSGNSTHAPATASDVPTLCWLADSYGVTVFLPHWFVILLTGMLGVVPWIRWRFTTRALLIATTLVAVVLGLAVYFASH